MTIDIKLALFAAVCLLNIADIYTTLKILANGGQEKNSVVAWLMRKLGTASALLVFKAAALGLVYSLLHATPVWLLAALMLWYAWVVAHNVNEMRK